MRAKWRKKRVRRLKRKRRKTRARRQVILSPMAYGAIGFVLAPDADLGVCTASKHSTPTRSKPLVFLASSHCLRTTDCHHPRISVWQRRPTPSWNVWRNKPNFIGLRSVRKNNEAGKIVSRWRTEGFAEIGGGLKARRWHIVNCSCYLTDKISYEIIKPILPHCR